MFSRWTLVGAIVVGLSWLVRHVMDFPFEVTDVALWAARTVTLPLHVGSIGDLLLAPVVGVVAVMLHRRGGEMDGAHPYAIRWGLIAAVPLGLDNGLCNGSSACAVEADVTASAVIVAAALFGLGTALVARRRAVQAQRTEPLIWDIGFFVLALACASLVTAGLVGGLALGAITAFVTAGAAACGCIAGMVLRLGWALAGSLGRGLPLRRFRDWLAGG